VERGGMKNGCIERGVAKCVEGTSNNMNIVWCQKMTDEGRQACGVSVVRGMWWWILESKEMGHENV